MKHVLSGTAKRVLQGGFGVALLGLACVALGQEPSEANYDEAKVPAYVLPDPLRLADGREVTSTREWWDRRRPEILESFRSQVYGRSPGRPRGMRFEVLSVEPRALGGEATRKEVRVWLTGKKDGPWMDVLVYLPNWVHGRAPVFLGLNFDGNHTVTWETDVAITPRWVSNDPAKGRVDHRATEKARGSAASRWALRQIVARGYAVATVYCGDLELDHVDGWKQGGVRSIFRVGGEREAVASKEPITELAPDAWGAIGAWAWGLSRALDYLETDPRVDPKHVAVIGHSRLGKTSLWAGAQDKRFAMVISNDSGEGGAALARRYFGETTRRLNKVFPHWFCGNFKQYSDHEDRMPVDQHELIALAAPRPVYVASAEKDLWADPHGEFLAAQGAEPVYALFGKPGLGVKEMPALDRPVGAWIGYHIRHGVHDVTDYDWARYLDFADRHFQRPKL